MKVRQIRKRGKLEAASYHHVKMGVLAGLHEPELVNSQGPCLTLKASGLRIGSRGVSSSRLPIQRKKVSKFLFHEDRLHELFELFLCKVLHYTKISTTKQSYSGLIV